MVEDPIGGLLELRRKTQTYLVPCQSSTAPSDGFFRKIDQVWLGLAAISSFSAWPRLVFATVRQALRRFRR